MLLKILWATNKAEECKARKPLYPQLPGEQAVDRLLNQTLPNILQQREQRLQRQEDIQRQERIRKEDIARSDARYLDAKAEKDLERNDRISNQIFTLRTGALERFEDGDFSAGDAYIDRIAKVSRDNGMTLDFNPEELRTEGQRIGNVKSAYNSMTTNFYQAKDSAAVESSIGDIMDYYKANSDIIDFDRQVQPLLSYMLQNRNTDLYRDLYENKNFDAFASGTKNYVAFQNSIQFKLTDEITDAFYAKNQRVGTTEEYEKFYFESRQAKENTKVAADAYMSTTASNFETNNFSNYFMDGDKLKGQFTEAEFNRVYIDYREAMTKREYGATKDYTSLTKEQQKKVNSNLTKEYGFPTVNYSSPTPDPETPDPGTPDPIKTETSKIDTVTNQIKSLEEEITNIISDDSLRPGEKRASITEKKKKIDSLNIELSVIQNQQRIDAKKISDEALRKSREEKRRKDYILGKGEGPETIRPKQGQVYYGTRVTGRGQTIVE